MLEATGHTNSSSSKVFPKDSFHRVITTSKLVSTICTTTYKNLLNFYLRALRLSETKVWTTGSMNLSISRRHLTKVATSKMSKWLVHSSCKTKTSCWISQELISRISDRKQSTVVKSTKARSHQIKPWTLDSPLFKTTLSSCFRPRWCNKDNCNNQR